MKVLIIFFNFILFTACSSEQDTSINRMNNLSFIKTIKLAETDSTFISNINNISFFADSNFIINSSIVGNAYIYSNKNGNLIKSIYFGSDLIDTMKSHSEKFDLFCKDNYWLLSFNELVDNPPNKFKDLPKDSFRISLEKTITRSIIKTIILNDQSLVHMVKVSIIITQGTQRPILKDKPRRSGVDMCLIVKTNPYDIEQCFMPQSIYDNGDPYFPLYKDFEVSRNVENLYYLNCFNEFFIGVARNVQNALKQKFYSTMIHNSDYTKLELASPLPELLVREQVFYSLSYPKYILNNDELYYCFPLIDTIYNNRNHQSFPLKINADNEYFFDKFDYDDYEKMNYKHLGFRIETLSKNKKGNIIIVSRIYEDFLQNDARLAWFRIQEYDKINFKLLRSATMPFKRDEDLGGTHTTIQYICAEPNYDDTIVIAYSNEENWFIDYYKW